MIFADRDLNRLYRYCVALTQDETQAKDLLQESLKRYFLSTDRRTIASPINYVLKIIRNCFIDYLRSSNRAPFDDSSELQLEVVHIDCKTIEEVMIEREEAARLLGLLEVREREILYLWAVEEWTVQEIAEHMSAPLGTVLSKLHRLRKKIVRQLELEQGDEKELKTKR